MTNEDPEDEILETAMDFLLQLQERPADPVLRRELDAWLAAASVNRRGWTRAQQAWRLVGDVPPVTAAAWSDSEAPIAERTPRRRVFAAAAAVALAACIALAVVPSLTLRWAADYTTAAGETDVIELADGSIVHLAPESAFETGFTGHSRNVRLLAGEAYFEVAPDAARPFTVTADGLTARALGTAFNVRRSDEALAVGVSHGRVAVGHADTRPPLKTVLTAGATAKVDRRTGQATIGEMPAADIAAWRGGKFFFDNATVAEVVAEIDRYQPGWVVIVDAGLAQSRVTGLYDVREPVRALGALVKPSGGAVRNVTPYLHVLSVP